MPAFPIEYVSNLHTGQRLQHECPGQGRGGHLMIIGSFVCTIGIELYYRRSMVMPANHNPAKPTVQVYWSVLDQAFAPAWAA